MEDFSQPINLCPVDLRKVVTHTKCDPIERYKLLLDFYTKYEMTSEKEWVQKRLAWINETEVEAPTRMYSLSFNAFWISITFSCVTNLHRVCQN